MTDGLGKHLGIIRTYADLHEILRLRADELRMTRMEIDRLAKLGDGHASILLAPRPRKKLGKTSWDKMMPSLALMFIAVEDPEALARITPHMEKRKTRVVMLAVKVGRGKHRLASKRFLRKIARLGGVARMEQMTPSQRRKHCRLAAKARWEKKQPPKAQVRCPPG